MMQPTSLRLAFAALGGLALILVSVDVAHAHSVNKQFGDFYGGMLHPLTAWEHFLPTVGLGLLAGQQGTSASRWVVLLFALGILLGAMLGVPLEPVVGIEWFNRLSLVVLGILIAANVHLPIPLAAILALVTGLTHGYENTADVTTVSMYLFVPGVVASGTTLVAVSAAISASREASWQKLAVRVVGSWITAIGILVIGMMA